MYQARPGCQLSVAGPSALGSENGHLKGRVSEKDQVRNILAFSSLHFLSLSGEFEIGRFVGAGPLFPVATVEL